MAQQKKSNKSSKPVALDQYLCLRQATQADQAMEMPDVNVETAAMFTKNARWVPPDTNKTDSRTYTIEAHLQYLKLVHHIPLVSDPSNFENAVKSMPVEDRV
ncbi:hypothetical protein HO173_003180 [Letharia columbiana]|uniref:Uncharacterized protein n=1 Tax=Letharia columbiana TaxID=112416 RepID=A0A8H6G1A0_9LECA|nr:uncharacterized protein HO173_003180 [Letharia columbiana]KAF6238674.1 hypothetical protein HO173_003180 [Letharia columbiana]